jgi:type I site-specific restriction endonuclease
MPPGPVEVVYNAGLPREAFDLVIVDECHRSISGVSRGVLEYLDEYRIKTDITEHGATVEAGSTIASSLLGRATTL